MDSILSAGSLRYFVAEQGPVQIVSFVGPMTRQNEGVVDQCAREILKRGASWVILNFRDVPVEIDRKIFRTLVQMQKVLREHPKMVRICGMHPDLYALLEENGVVRREEVFPNVAEILQSIREG